MRKNKNINLYDGYGLFWWQKLFISVTYRKDNVRFKRFCEEYKRVKTQETKELLRQAIKQLCIYGSCSICDHCDREKYPLIGYCNIGGCCGSENGKTKEDMWQWNGMRVENDE